MLAGIDVVGARAVRVRYAAPPPGELPALPTDVVMLDASDAVTVGDSGPAANLRNGASTDLGTGVIERTSDGGAQWKSVLSVADANFTWIGRDGADVVAAGLGLNSGALILARSGDGGVTWTLIRPRVGRDKAGPPPWVVWQTLAFSGHGEALAAPQDQLESPDVARLADGVLRSSDDGRSWRLVRLPDGGQANGEVTWTADGETAFVTGDTDLRGCPTALWRSDDAGARWKLVRSACSLPDVFAVAFSNARDGIVGGGYDPVYTPLQFIARTSDAGAAWQVTWRAPTPHQARTLISGAGPAPIVALTFAGPLTAWAVPGGTHQGANTPYVGDALVSTDGGSHWTDTQQVASAIGPLAAGSAFAVAPIDQKAPLAALAHTSDGGSSWTPVISPAEVEATDLLGAGRELTDFTSAGTFTSSDGGMGWRRVAFADETHALALTHYVSRGAGAETVQQSDDGERSWRSSASIPHFREALAAALTGRVAAAIAGQPACGCYRIATSASPGQLWSGRVIPRSLDCGGIAARERELWVFCDDAATDTRSTMFHSTDGGHTWRAERFPNGLAIQTLVATGPGQAMASMFNPSPSSAKPTRRCGEPPTAAPAGTKAGPRSRSSRRSAASATPQERQLPRGRPHARISLQLRGPSRLQRLRGRPLEVLALLKGFELLSCGPG
jgi:hypothetical protein